MIALIIPLVACIILLFLNTRKRRAFFTASNIPLSLYLASALLSFWHVSISPTVVDFVPTVVLTFSLLFVLVPLLYVNDGFIEEFNRLGQDAAIGLGYLVSFLSVLSSLFYVRFIGRVFDANVGDVRMLHNRGLAESNAESGILNTIAAATTSLYLLSMFLFFYVAVVAPRKKLLLGLLLFGSLCEPFRVFSQYGRDGAVFWILPVVQLFMVFRHQMRPEVRRVGYIGLAGASAVLLAAFAIVTFSRFGRDGGRAGVIESLVSYIGQSYPNYTQVYEYSDSFRAGGVISFNWILSLFGLSSSEQAAAASDEWFSIYLGDGSFGNVFATFMREWTIDFGPYGALLLSALVGGGSMAVFRSRKPAFGLFKSYYYTFYSLFLIQGLFYFRLKFNNANLMIALSLAIVAAGYFGCSSLRRGHQFVPARPRLVDGGAQRR